MTYDALLVVDVQTALIDQHPDHERTFLQDVKRLLAHARAHHIPVIHVRHDGGSGDELEYGSAGWQIHPEIAPQDEELVIDKQFNSAFRNTALRQELTQRNIKHIVLCGMQTEYCIDATCKVAFEYGYQITIAQGTTTTYDNQFFTGAQLCAFYELGIWNHRYADVIPVDRVLD